VAGGAWQPIETAPRDGTWVLVFGHTKAGPRSTVARYMIEPNLGEHWEIAVVGREHPSCNVIHHCHVHPTHWMRLPKPPKVRR
jgi:hypothetical protein